MRARATQPVLGALAVLLGACASAPPAPTPPRPNPAAAHGEASSPSLAAGPADHDFERRQIERARRMQRQGRLADAALAWEILAVLRPDVSEYRERWAATRQAIDAAVTALLQQAKQPRARADAEAASRLYLGVLALQPDHAGAADALRDIERERNRRLYLGRPSRLTITTRDGQDAAPAVQPQPASGPAPSRPASGPASGPAGRRGSTAVGPDG